VLNEYLTMLFPLGPGETPLAGLAPDVPAEPGREPARRSAAPCWVSAWLQSLVGRPGRLPGGLESRPCRP
jgi:hypothetical protein